MICCKYTSVPSGFSFQSFLSALHFRQLKSLFRFTSSRHCLRHVFLRRDVVALPQKIHELNSTEFMIIILGQICKDKGLKNCCSAAAVENRDLKPT